jgi:hypothetical protein
MKYVTIEAPIELLESIRSIQGIESGAVQPVDSVGDVVYGPMSERMKSTAVAIGLLTACFQSAQAAASFADEIHNYYSHQDQAAVVQVVEPGTGKIIVQVNSSTSSTDIIAAVEPKD